MHHAFPSRFQAQLFFVGKQTHAHSVHTRNGLWQKQEKEFIGYTSTRAGYSLIIDSGEQDTETACVARTHVPTAVGSTGATFTFLATSAP